jgi:hypothetical protein
VIRIWGVMKLGVLQSDPKVIKEIINAVTIPGSFI